MSPTFDTDRYLSRINYQGERAVTVECLRALHRHHVLAVPFEATDIHYGRTIQLDPEYLFDKVIVRRRGGFCYELNSLFYRLLRELGFTVRMVSASVYNEGICGPPFDHLCLIVDLDGLWLADVGFGDLFLEPVRIIPDAVQRDRDNDFRLEQTGKDSYLLLASRSRANAYEAKYCFDLTARRPEDFAEQCRWKQSSPDSHFVKNFICTLATEEGRITIKNGVLKERRHDEVRERPLANETDLKNSLHKFFGL